MAALKNNVVFVDCGSVRSQRLCELALRMNLVTNTQSLSSLLSRIYICSAGNASKLENLLDEILSCRMQCKSCLIIDNIAVMLGSLLFTDPRSNGLQRLAIIGRKLKRIAQDLKIPVIISNKGYILKENGVIIRKAALGHWWRSSVPTRLFLENENTAHGYDGKKPPAILHFKATLLYCSRMRFLYVFKNTCSFIVGECGCRPCDK